MLIPSGFTEECPRVRPIILSAGQIRFRLQNSNENRDTIIIMPIYHCTTAFEILCAVLITALQKVYTGAREGSEDGN